MRHLRVAAALAAALALTSPGIAAAETSSAPPSVAAQQQSLTWVGSWGAPVQHATTAFVPDWSEVGFANHSVRQVVRLTEGGVAARIRLSNAYGATPLRVSGATVARTASGADIRPGTVRHLTVGHQRSFTIAPGAEVATDAVPLPVAPLESVTVTLYFAEPTGPTTYHWYANTDSYRATGDHRADPAGTAFTETTQAWYYLAGVDVIKVFPRRTGVIAFGDSITDGYGATPGANNRYPDELAERLRAEGRPRAVINQGIGGNRVTADSPIFGDKGTARFKRDVLDQPNVGTVIVLEGINDIGMSGQAFPPGTPPQPEVSVEQLIAGHRELIAQARAAGVRVIGATLLPYKGADYFTAEGEAKRDALNHWIRTSGEYDAVVDFERAVVSPTDPDLINPAYHMGDYLHPNDAGYRVMADAVDPAAFAR
ncbi:lysophospholipase L1-like esterase [Herbihabitans rhizosphaerae]|uniref:Lysophospholipase L1-like esterase n=1 Tax=Herbihabitans rhizosphaerae TaxID=1872711 RepID=A0A4Q7L5M0_9PSEU|nr:SGNH/GDSL hydrolase family protein [Herbihabitans rhizosphaerae]RZS44627.1 lysophospholipase L1-like esterase [Herbihabitans rhizosphaerae]